MGGSSRELVGDSLCKGSLELLLFILFSIRLKSLQRRFTKESKTINRKGSVIPNNEIRHMFGNCGKKIISPN